MGVTRLLAAALACAATVAVAHAQDRLPPRLTVTGEAHVSVAPDYAVIRLGVTAQAKTAREASESNARSASALVTALRGAGIDDKDIQTTRLSLQPTYEGAVSGRTARITGFQASNQVTIKVREVARLADVIDRAIAAGATDMGGIDFQVTAPSQALDHARAEAVADARRKADLYAKTAGVTLGRVLALSEDQAAQEPVPMMARAAAPATPISPGERTLRVTVTVSYELTN
jgi:uncharacterized protein YggE